MDINASPQGDRVYAVGAFSILNGVTLNPNHQAIIDTATGAAVPGLKPWVPIERGDHRREQRDPRGRQPRLPGRLAALSPVLRPRRLLRSSAGFITQNTGGDYQALATKDGIVYGSCHCVTDYQYEDTTGFPTPQGYTRVDPINLIGAYDMTNNLEVVPEFHPTQLTTAGDGPWALFFDTNGCMWAGGDLRPPGRLGQPPTTAATRSSAAATRTAPTTPGNSHAALNGNDVTLTWNASTDNAATPIHYEILKDDPTFGTIVMGSTFDRTFTDTNVVDPSRYFIRAVDDEGNRSATTAVLSGHASPAGGRDAPGARRQLVLPGRRPGSRLRLARSPASTAPSWATGASQLGWGGKGETTVIPSAAITSYFVKHQSIANPGQYKTITIRLKRDDGAVVYVNGIPVVRDNMPAGPLTAATLASSSTSGAAETTWFEHQVPASLFKSGDNTIAAEVHQAGASNADGIFDLELVARNGSETTAPTDAAPRRWTTSTSPAPRSAGAPSTDNTAVIGYLVRRNGTPVAFTAATSFVDTGSATARRTRTR